VPAIGLEKFLRVFCFKRILYYLRQIFLDQKNTSFLRLEAQKQLFFGKKTHKKTPTLDALLPVTRTDGRVG